VKQVVLSFLFLVLALAGPAQAQGCQPRDPLVAHLGERYAEEPRMQAMTTPGALLEMFVAPSGSWTIILTRPDGISCPLAAGQGVEMISAPDGDPA